MHALKSLLKAISIVSFLLACTAGLYIALNSGDIPPPDVSDLEVPYPDVRDEENALTLYEQAAPAFDLDFETLEPIQTEFGEPFDNPDAAEELLRSFEVPLATIARGARMERCIFPRPTSISSFLPSVNSFLKAGNIWNAEVKLALQQGDLQRAEHATQNLLRFGRSVIAEPETLIQYLIGTAVLAHGAQAVEQVVMYPQASEENLATLNRILMMDEVIDQALVQALKSEYRFFELAMEALVQPMKENEDKPEMFDHPIARFFPGFFLKPNETRSIFAGSYRNAIANVGKNYSGMYLEDEDERMETVRKQQRFPPPPNFGGIMLQSFLLPALNGAFLRYSQLLSHLRGLRTLCALRRFELERGHLPHQLSSLAPLYLEEVPRDPFDGEVFRYDPERRIIWSVGEDLVDQNGSTVQRDGTRTGADGRRYQEDMVWEMGW